MDKITISDFANDRNTNDNATKEQAITLEIKNVSGHLAIVSFNTPPGNNPSLYCNTVSIWQGGDVIPWGVAPLRSQLIGSASPYGSVVIDNLNLGDDDYIIGYGVGKDVSQIVATAYIPDTAQEGSQSNDYQYFSTSIKVTAFDKNVVAYHYCLPEGFDPIDHNVWVGLWESRQIRYPAENPLAKGLLKKKTDEGDYYLDKLSLARGQSYILGLFAGGSGLEKATSLCATSAFTYLKKDG